MPKLTLQLKFDPNQDFQIEAIQSVVDVFKNFPKEMHGSALWDGTVPNLPSGETLSETWLLDNVNAVQERNKITPTAELVCDEDMVLEGAGNESVRYPSFTIEMETGTGKTYVYLRTIYELRKAYGFGKFVIVVPSIAIYEGVIKSFQIMKSHFNALYGNENVHLLEYDSSRMSMLRGFADSPFVEILVITMQAFNTATGRSSNKIYRTSEQLPGEKKPYEYIQETRPILILDEPQNMESPLSKAALRTLHPLFALRYSATHKEAPNQLYTLTPFDAYQRGLVKSIQVDGVFESNELDPQRIILRDVKTSPLRATLHALAFQGGQSSAKDIELRHGDNLFSKTNNPAHQHGFKVIEISARKNATFVEFDGAGRISIDDIYGSSRHQIFKTQIERTIEYHMRAQARLSKRGIKVLSLFFIDRVANYIDDDGIIKRLFDEAFEAMKVRYPWFAEKSASQVRQAYFARKKPAKGQEEGDAFDTSSSNNEQREAERDAFKLIMRDKERLLSFEEPVSFIFAHSALKEGWDNPNVFQICTLNQTVSEMKKRQEIGRGLRLPVDQNGDRVFDESVNVLTVIANESYDTYASSLQTEYHEAGYDKAPPPPSNVGKSKVKRNDQVFQNEHFRKFWSELCQQSRYVIKVDTEALINSAVVDFNSLDISQLNPRIIVETGQFVMEKVRIKLEKVIEKTARLRVIFESSAANQLFADEVAFSCIAGDKLMQKCRNDKRLRSYVVQEVVDDSDRSFIHFENDVKLFVGEEDVSDSEVFQKPVRTEVKSTSENQPIPNVLDRAAKETGLTRQTINRILKDVDRVHLEMLFKNPEGFTNLFIARLKEVLANHIIDRLEFKFEINKQDLSIEKFFPEEHEFPQKELVDAGEAGIYDRVQVDSDVERRFVEKYLSGGDDRVIGFFKFPASYKVDLPRIIGNYNPDWGILRYDQNRNVVLHLVRETKGGEDVERLRFSNEGRKVKAAERHFKMIGVDYRMVSDTTPNWWEKRGV